MTSTAEAEHVLGRATKRNWESMLADAFPPPMPAAPLPDELDAFLRRPNPAVVATVRSDGSPHTVATWYDWDGSEILLSMDESRVRLRFMRKDPRVALTVVDEDGWSRHVSLLGRVVSLEEDTQLRDIDRLARRYTGQPFRTRDRRRFSARVRVDTWHAWDGSRPWSPATRNSRSQFTPRPLDAGEA